MWYHAPRPRHQQQTGSSLVPFHTACETSNLLQNRHLIQNVSVCTKVRWCFKGAVTITSAQYNAFSALSVVYHRPGWNKKCLWEELNIYVICLPSSSIRKVFLPEVRSLHCCYWRFGKNWPSINIWQLILQHSRNLFPVATHCWLLWNLCWDEQRWGCDLLFSAEM